MQNVTKISKRKQAFIVSKLTSNFSITTKNGNCNTTVTSKSFLNCMSTKCTEKNPVQKSCSQQRESSTRAFLSTAGSQGRACDEKTIEKHLAVQAMIRGYQVRGHYLAQVDPLGISDQVSDSDRAGSPPKIILEHHKLQESDMDTEFKLPPTTSIGGKDTALPLREIIRRLEQTYCKHIGLEYMFINSVEKCDWLRQKFETPSATDISADEKRLTLARLTRATQLEKFMGQKYPNEKRFGIDGLEMLIPSMKTIIDKSTEHGVDSVIISMAHRGRLNVLANVCRKPLHHIFTQFYGLEAADLGSGDVKYHLGTSIDRLNRVTNKHIRIALLANPSHLEVVAPIGQGKARAEQFFKGDKEGKTVLSIILHGDASMCGQGVVFETLQLTDLPAYTTHGEIHIIVNNQVGFTTDPRFAKSSRYCSDVGKVVHAPIIHVNADEPDSVIHVSKVAAEWRAKFAKSVVIDLVGYRRFGHNEVDQPMFTQPLMYQKINTMKNCMDKYSEQLIKERIVTKEEVNDVQSKYEKICLDEFAIASKLTQIKNQWWLDSPWKGFFKGKDLPADCKTGVKEETLIHIGKHFSSPPKDTKFIIHEGLLRVLKARMHLLEEKKVDWATAEAMAFGSLLKDGIHVRLSGEDVERGTFSQRHHVLHHQKIDKATYRPLDNLYPDQAPYTVCNSSLSEYAILGFEHGYSLANPNCLVLWEAEFGDFSNVAQCVIDQYISAGEIKWIRQSGLVMLLPHGMEGQGPEHSSARLERFLTMAAEDPDTLPPDGEDVAMRQLHDTNWIVANLTSPANYFHILRRQIALPFRKPLIIMSAKGLLRLPEARSSISDMTEGTEFQRIIPEQGPAFQKPEKVERLIFCSGRVFYDVAKAIKEKKLNSRIALTRIEQLAPFPFDLVKKECEKYGKAQIVWVQEEHKNQGGWSFVEPRLETILGSSRGVSYVGRPVSASPATGNKQQYLKELANFLQEATAF
ncbi:unnamed protein product [Phaedon cochleariae]|uniref:oxoglutarate dehydrogenase (succinyl-transferring) n=1 Tax=Phaedon cochleariae TaxID=80249 RepID=A0A9N9S989_PHACE|nr:unnamed protein product [Phaedon cochleariae]